MSQRQAVTKAKARAYVRADRARKSQILDELVELTGWHRDWARAALRDASRLRVVRPRAARPALYGPRIIAALITCWAVLRAPAGKRLAPMLAVLVPILRRDGELDLTDDEAALLVRMSAATIDRRLAGERARMMPRGRSHTKPGSLNEIWALDALFANYFLPQQKLVFKQRKAMMPLPHRLPRPEPPQVTSRPAAAQHLRDLARLRRVRDRIDREYAQPLDVEALARGAHMSVTKPIRNREAPVTEPHLA